MAESEIDEGDATQKTEPQPQESAKDPQEHYEHEVTKSEKYLRTADNSDRAAEDPREEYTEDHPSAG